MRSPLFALLIGLLVAGGYAHEFWMHATPTHECKAEHQHSNSEEQGGCHHCTCHCSQPMAASFERTTAFQVPTLVGDVAAYGEYAPETVPVGIDHPPQLA